MGFRLCTLGFVCMCVKYDNELFFVFVLKCVSIIQRYIESVVKCFLTFYSVESKMAKE